MTMAATVMSSTVSYPAKTNADVALETTTGSSILSPMIIPADVLFAETTCCKPHLDKDSCFGEQGSNCVWFDDPNHEIAVLSRAQCIGKRWAKCKMIDLDSACKTNSDSGAKHANDKSSLSQLPQSECRSIDIKEELDQCRATLFANGADTITISVSHDGGNTYKELSFHSDYKLTAHHLIENVDEHTIIVFDVDASNGNDGGLIADVHLKNTQNGEVDRIFTHGETESIDILHG